jgi:thymidine phosphorylase
MESPERARELANSIIATALNAKLKTHALITDMNEVLGTTVGNALEIRESVLYLRNEVREPRLDEVVLSLCAEMVLLGGIEPDRDAARARCEEAVTSGKAAEIFARMIAALGGPADFIDNYDTHLAKAPVTRAVHADGVLTSVNTRAVGNAIIELGGGRRKVGETLDFAVGFSNFASVGCALGKDRPLAVIHAASDDDADIASRNLLTACQTGETAPERRAVISEILTGQTRSMR